MFIFIIILKFILGYFVQKAEGTKFASMARKAQVQQVYLTLHLLKSLNLS